jgi:glycosyltransferase involved in cell wall biosynthesis
MSEIHLINSFEAFGGAELRTLALFDLLKGHAAVKLWATREIDQRIKDINKPINTITETHFPQGGTMIFIGCYQPLLGWLKQAKAHRTALLFNSADFNLIPRTLLSLSLLGARIEMIYAAKWMRDACGFPGIVQPSTIDMNAFYPNNKPPRADGRFRVGRHSRDTYRKFHSDDPQLFQRLVENGCHIKLMGGTVLSPQLAANAHIELLAEGHEPAHSFLQSLDCFYYHTHDDWMEASGRVVTEAMACGLPVVVHRRGGYAEYITHGNDGLIFDTPQQAYEMISFLKNNREAAKAMGQKARATMEKVFSAEANAQIVSYYTAENAPVIQDSEFKGMW